MIRMFVRWPAPSAWVAYADTVAGNPAASRQPRTTPATKAPQLKLPKSLGTLTNLFLHRWKAVARVS